LIRAFRLAYFIHRDKQRALLIAAAALSKLEVAAAAQDKRLYYTPAGRLPSDGERSHRPRTKVAMSEFHLLQRLVYVESEAYEKREESVAHDACIDEEDMIIRFIKHLVRITTRRNSFYVALGLARLLYQYTTNETAEIYDLVIQDSERFKDDHYYRSRKRRLLQELSERFGNLIRIAKSKSGEERFESDDHSRARLPLVSSCLDQFTPWNTPCPLPERPDLGADEILALRFDGEDPDQEHPVEVRRMHALIHPTCYSRLVAALGFDSTDLKLAVPRFSLAKSNGGSAGRPGDRTKPPVLTDEEMTLVGAELADNARRRKASSARLLAIRVDGVQIATIDLNRETSASFNVDDNAELIEVLTRDSRGDLLLASHLLSFDEDSGPASTTLSIQLEGGQKVTFKISPANKRAGITDSVVVDVSYFETSIARAAAFFTQRLWRRLADSSQPGRSGLRITPRPALAAALGLLFAAGILLYIRPWRSVEPREIAHDASKDGGSGPVVSPGPLASTSSSQQDSNTNHNGASVTTAGAAKNANSRTNANRRSETVPRSLPEAPSIADYQPPDQNREPVTNATDTVPTDTRGAPRFRAKKLAVIKHIYIESLGSSDFADAIRRELGQALDKSGQLNTVSTKDQADAVLKGAATASAAEPKDQAILTGKVAIKLIAADGSTLWSWPPSGSASNPGGTPSHLASLISDDLIQKIRAVR
jgi:hypothetical protein